MHRLSGRLSVGRGSSPRIHEPDSTILKVGNVPGRKGCAVGEGCGGDQGVHLCDGLTQMLARSQNLSVAARTGNVESEDLTSKIARDHAFDRFAKNSLFAPRGHSINSRDQFCNDNR